MTLGEFLKQNNASVGFEFVHTNIMGEASHYKLAYMNETECCIEVFWLNGSTELSIYGFSYEADFKPVRKHGIIKAKDALLKKGWTDIGVFQNKRILVAPKAILLDWYEAKRRFGEAVPTKEELNFMYQNKEKIGVVGGYYWSSTEVDSGYSWYQRFSGGTQDNYNKSYACLVRCVRRLDV